MNPCDQTEEQWEQQEKRKRTVNNSDKINRLCDRVSTLEGQLSIVLNRITFGQQGVAPQSQTPNRFIEAIKTIRSVSGLSLKETKNIADALKKGGFLK